jgi:peptide/nickel transport system permease protein
MPKSKIKLPIIIVGFYMLVGFFNSLIANEHPLIAMQNGNWVFPAFNDFLEDLGFNKASHNFNVQTYNSALYAPIQYRFNSIDEANANFQHPLKNSAGAPHIFGTDGIGRDVAAGVVRGCYTSLRIGVFGTLFCAFLGILLGISGAYFGNTRLRTTIPQLLFFLLIILLFLFYIIYHGFAFWGNWLLLFIVILCFTLYNIFFNKRASSKYSIPIDNIFLRIIELRRSIPMLIFILVLIPLFTRPSSFNIVVLITVLGWTSFARHARAETLTIKERDFVHASNLMGARFWHILINHILPNISTTLIVLACANFASNILLESTLSFLGIGLPPEEVSWGSQLSEARKNMHAWWMFVFPGMIMFILVYFVNKIGDNASPNNRDLL